MKPKHTKDFSHEFNSFVTLNTRDTPVTMQEGEMPLCVNFMPIGTQLYTIPGYEVYYVQDRSTSVIKKIWSILVTEWSDPHTHTGEFVYPELLYFTEDGRLWYYDIFNGGIPLCEVGTLSNPTVEQYGQWGALIADPNGIFSWYRECAAITAVSKDNGIMVVSGVASTQLKTTADIQFVQSTYTTFFEDTQTGTSVAPKDPLSCTIIDGPFDVAIGKSRRGFVQYDEFTGLWYLQCGTEAADLASSVLPQNISRRSIIAVLNITNNSVAPYTYGSTIITTAGIVYNVVPYQACLNRTVLGSTANAAPFKQARNGYTGADGEITNATPTAAYSVTNWKTRSWWVVGNKRTLQYSAPLQPFDFNTANTAGLVIDRHASLRTAIAGFAPTPEYLYAIGDHATHLIFGLQVLDTGTVVFNLSDGCPGAGALYPDTIEVVDSAAVMFGPGGIKAVSGNEATLLSSYLDGQFTKLDVSGSYPSFYPVSCVSEIFHKTCYVLLARVYDLQDNASKKLLFCLYEGRWFAVDYFTGGIDLNWVTTAMPAGETITYGVAGHTIYKLFSGNSVPLRHRARSRATNLGMPITDKQVTRVGAMVIARQAFTQMVASMSVFGNMVSGQVNVVIDYPESQWINNRGLPVSWKNYTGVVAIWTTEIQSESMDAAQIDARGKRLQVEFDETSAFDYILSGLMIEGQYGVDW